MTRIRRQQQTTDNTTVISNSPIQITSQESTNTPTQTQPVFSNNAVISTNLTQQVNDQQQQAAQTPPQSTTTTTINNSTTTTDTSDNIPIQQEHWLKSFWRPAMAWLYMIICFMDFVGFPIVSMFLPVIWKTAGVTTLTYVPWVPLTLSNGGMIHLSFGAILGVTAWTRSVDKANNNQQN